VTAVGRKMIVPWFGGQISGFDTPEVEASVPHPGRKIACRGGPLARPSGAGPRFGSEETNKTGTLRLASCKRSAWGLTVARGTSVNSIEIIAMLGKRSRLERARGTTLLARAHGDAWPDSDALGQVHVDVLPNAWNQSVAHLVRIFDVTGQVPHKYFFFVQDTCNENGYKHRKQKQCPPRSERKWRAHEEK